MKGQEMADTDNTVKVDGVEPSILVKYVGNSREADTNTRVDLFPDEDGNPRHLTLGGEPVYITKDELNRMAGQFQLEFVEKDSDVPADREAVEKADEGPDPQELQPSQAGTLAPTSTNAPAAAQPKPATPVPPGQSGS